MDERSERNQGFWGRRAAAHRWAWRCAWVLLIAMTAAWLAPHDLGLGAIAIGPSTAPWLTLAYAAAILASWATSGRWLWLPSARVVHQAALAIAALFAVAIAAALVAPGTWQVGRLQVTLRTWVRPATWLSLAAMVAFVTSPGCRTKCMEAVRQLACVPRTFSRLRLAMVAFTLLVGWRMATAAQALLQYPTTSADWFAMFDDARRDDEFNGQRRPNFEHFCALVIRDTPPDARILYHGHCLTITDKAHPRRIFMLPQEQFAMFRESVLNQGWGRRRRDDPLDRYWRQDTPPEPVSREEFIRRHRITHEATFDETDWAGCRVEAVH